MNKRFRFLILFCVLFFSVFLTSCTRYEKTIECNANLQEEVLIMSEFVRVKDFNDNAIGIGVISFKVGNYLYAVGHNSSLEDISNLSVYKILPVFKPSTRNHLGQVFCTDDFEKLLPGKITQDSDDGMIISTEELDTTMYSSVTVANKIFSGDAELLMRDETGELYNYSISVKIINNSKEKYLEISVTDERLLAKTGGIIPGMSGCPIIQDDKLIGIVTHTYVNNPRKGLGKIVWNIDCIKNKNNN